MESSLWERVLGTGPLMRAALMRAGGLVGPSVWAKILLRFGHGARTREPDHSVLRLSKQRAVLGSISG
jgi:hypothetical protein